MKSSTWFLVLAVGLIGYVIWQGGEQRFGGSGRAAQGLNYDTLAVSQGLTPEAQALNLQDDLDVSLLPEIGRQAIRAAAQQGLREQAFLEAVLRDVSDRVREISTIDLNEDGTADPILVRPEPSAQEQYVLLSLQVPAPDAYPLPAAGDTQAWQRVETVEVATLTVSLSRQELTVQAAGSPYAYPPANQQPYTVYDRSPSFLETYFAIRMLDWMFFPRSWGFWGPGWGYGYYRPQPVPVARDGREATVRGRGYQRAGTEAPALRDRSGAVPTSRYQRANPSRPPRALADLQASRRFSRRTPGAAVGSGGFGRRQSVGGAPAAPAPRYGSTRSAPRGFGRSTPGYRSRGLGGGFGSRSFGRGFGGFGRGFRR